MSPKIFSSYHCSLQTQGYSLSLLRLVSCLSAHLEVFMGDSCWLENVQDIYIFSHRIPALTSCYRQACLFFPETDE